MLIIMLLLLVFFVASFFNHFFGIHNHPFSMNQSNILKTLTVASRVFNDASTFLSSTSFYTSFGVLVLVDY